MTLRIPDMPPSHLARPPFPLCKETLNYKVGARPDSTSASFFFASSSFFFLLSGMRSSSQLSSRLEKQRSMTFLTKTKART